MGGMYGFYVSNMVLINCDLFINLGSRFDDCFVSKFDVFVLNVKVVYVDIDFFEINKVINIDLGIVVDCKFVFENLCYE